MSSVPENRMSQHDLPKQQSGSGPSKLWSSTAGSNMIPPFDAHLSGQSADHAHQTYFLCPRSSTIVLWSMHICPYDFRYFELIGAKFFATQIWINSTKSDHKVSSSWNKRTRLVWARMRDRRFTAYLHFRQVICLYSDFMGMDKCKAPQFAVPAEFPLFESRATPECIYA